MKELSYSPEMFADIMEARWDYFQTGETVCGAEDPAVVELSPRLGAKHPELVGYTMVRVVDHYRNPWKSDTVFVFSCEPVTTDEYAAYEDMMAAYGD